MLADGEPLVELLEVVVLGNERPQPRRRRESRIDLQAEK